jgi:hypothetical protein
VHICDGVSPDAALLEYESAKVKTAFTMTALKRIVRNVHVLLQYESGQHTIFL